MGREGGGGRDGGGVGEGEDVQQAEIIYSCWEGPLSPVE